MIKNRNPPDRSTSKLDKETQKSPRDLNKLADPQTSVKNYQF